MVQTKYKTIVVPSGTAKTTADALAGLGESTRLIVALWYAPNQSTDGVPDPEASIIASVNQDEVVEFKVAPFLTTDSDNANEWQGIKPRIEVNIELKIGEGFTVGLSSSGSISATNIIIEYQDR